MRTPQAETIVLNKIVGGGQALGQLPDGRKCFVWGGLPGETVEITITKKKSKMAEGVVGAVVEASPERIAPRDPESYLSTSPWQIMKFDSEQQYKAQLIDEAFTLHHVSLPNKTTVYSDKVQYGYRNKVEFSWYGSLGNGEEVLDDPKSTSELLDLAFFKRGSRGKVRVEGTSLAREEINILARGIRDVLHSNNISARQLKTLLIRCDQFGKCVWQLYVKDKLPNAITAHQASKLPAQGGEVIYSDPRSPASRITERLAQFGDTVLQDSILGTDFSYATEGFFQVNVPVYERALKDMSNYIPKSTIQNLSPTIDLYSGVGTIGLTIGSANTTMVEVNEDAVREMQSNIVRLGSSAQAVLAPTEKALNYITGHETVIVDPPRAGLHADVVDRLVETKPPRIIYLSCNPVTQARDIAGLVDTYKIVHTQGYNFFPRTPHIEHLVVLDLSV